MNEAENLNRTWSTLLSTLGLAAKIGRPTTLKCLRLTRYRCMQMQRELRSLSRLGRLK